MIRRSIAAVGVAALVAVPTLASHATAAPSSTAPTSSSATYAAASLSVSDALARQDGSTQTVRGYVVGQPTSTDQVATSDFPNDYALALADSPDETDPSRMLYVQVPSELRAQWGMASNPDNLGKQVEATGALQAYFSHAGLKNTSAIAESGSTEPTDPPTDPTDPPSEPTDPGDYYAGTEGLTGPELKSKLNSIISQQTVLSYDDVWDALGKTDEDPNNSANVIELYTGKSTPKTNNGGDADNWNREHVWAKSHGDFGTANGPGTDVHHLRPTDVTVNSDRGNLDFDEGGTENAEAPGNYADGDSWEPRDAVKGDVARMIFYMAVRYEGSDGHPDLEVNDQVDNGSNPLHGKLSVLKAWSQQDPPDAFEKNRNEVIYSSIQKNRNPFIDHPEWVEEIF